MRSIEAARLWLRTRWRRHAGEWMAGGGEWPLNTPLAVPDERAAGIDWSAFESWREQWRRPPGGEVAWGERQWPLLGHQAVPEKWWFEDAGAVAAVLGEGQRWRRASGRFATWAHRWPRLIPPLQRQFDLLADCDDVEFLRLGDMLAWLEAHPRSGLFVRQVPAAGIDTKWLETRTALLCEWLRTLAGRSGDFWQVSGLRRDAARVRLRLLDPVLRAHVGGLGDLQAPINELASWKLPIARVFIVENKQTGLAFEDLPGAVVMMACGYAVDRLQELPWLQGAASVYYWGDIDTHGLAILGRVRARLPQVRSLLMDEATLLANRPSWVDEPEPHRAKLIEHLTAAEQALYLGLRSDRWGVRVRLEQERISWADAWQQIVRASRNPAAQTSGPAVQSTPVAGNLLST